MTRSSTMPRACALASALLIAAAGSGNAEVLRVPGDYGTVEAALNAAVSGDSVLVGPGTYSEIGLLSIGSGVTLLGDGPREDIWIHVFEGITLEEGPEPVRMEGLSLNIDTETRPDVIWAENDQCEIMGNLIVDEYFHGDAGTLVFGTGAGLLELNWFESGRWVGVYLEQGGPWSVVRNTFAPTCELALSNRPASQLNSGPAVVFLSVRQNTFQGNVGFVAQEVDVVNNVVADFANVGCFSDQIESIHHNLFTHPDPQRACFPPDGGGVVNLWGADPEFCDAQACDYRVSPTSPAIGAGENGETLGAWPVGCGVVTVPGANTAHGEAPRPYPNPSTERVQLQPGRDAASVRVFDVTGRKIADLPVSPGGGVLTWDTRGEDGQHVAAGVYFLRVSRTDGSSTTHRVVLK